MVFVVLLVLLVFVVVVTILQCTSPSAACNWICILTKFSVLLFLNVALTKKRTLQLSFTQCKAAIRLIVFQMYFHGGFTEYILFKEFHTTTAGGNVYIKQ